MKAFYGSRFSPNMTKTPEGFLVCHNVPITRTGWLEYLGQELGLKDKYDQVIKVYRSDKEVFNSATMASFEGKSVTDGHPSNDVRADNYMMYEKGQVTNVRPSQDEPDLLLADLIIKDPLLISEVEHGKREVSCGYDCNYVPIQGEEGIYNQVAIRGNHVAVVPVGRAGSRVTIKDESPLYKKRTNERGKKMPILDKKSIIGRMLSAFARDAEPEEMAEAAKMFKEEEGEARDSMFQNAEQNQTAAPQAGGNNAVAELTKQVQALTEVVGQLLQAEKSEPNHNPDALESLAAELEGQKPTQDFGNEESVTVSPEQMNQDSEISAGPVSAANTRPDNPIPGADRNTILNAIKTMKPIIASIPDAGERKKASDALAKTFRDQMAVAPTNVNGYAMVQNAISANTKAKDKQVVDPVYEGKEWAKKFNPHYKEGK